MDQGDARFEDAEDGPLRLLALDTEDLKILAALVQDAIFVAADAAWLQRQRRFAVLVNRFRWEDAEAAERQHRPYERVRSLLIVDNVLRVRAQGVDPSERDTVMSILDMSFEGGADQGGTLTLTLAGDGAIAIDVEALEVGLKDVTRPYVAPSGKAPFHPI
ncbi:MAG: DUF2948 family protein [Alphaproteobacteria bacterium]|nr:MAG: DUF2948 family protein [Alphaproteobacteria bacterium]